MFVLWSGISITTGSPGMRLGRYSAVGNHAMLDNALPQQEKESMVGSTGEELGD